MSTTMACGDWYPYGWWGINPPTPTYVYPTTTTVIYSPTPEPVAGTEHVFAEAYREALKESGERVSPDRRKQLEAAALDKATEAVRRYIAAVRGS
jgi:hypothetical protein